MATKTEIERINSLAELEKAGIEFKPDGDSEVKLRCPVHEQDGDHSPSCRLNISKNLWQCHASTCKASGDIVSLLAYYAKCERATMLVHLSKTYNLGSVHTINPTRIEEYHNHIWGAGPLLKALYDRGLTDDDIRLHKLGYNNGRITIPIPDAEWRYVNVRKYLPGAPGPEKMKNVKNYGKPHIYGYEDLKFPIVWICGGEMKRIVAKRLLNPHGIGAMCITAGEGAWTDEATEKIAGKDVYICMDIDLGGRKACEMIGTQIYYRAKSVRIVHLPLDTNLYPKGDINDYVGQEKATDTDLLRCMELAEKFLPPEIEDDKDKPPETVSLSDATNAIHMGKRIEVLGVIQAMDNNPFIVPKDVKVSCTRDQPNCSWCPVRALERNDKGLVEMTVRGTSAGILEMVNTPKSQQKEALRESLRIPPCKVATFTIASHFNVTDIRLTSQLTIGSDSSETVSQPIPAFLVAHKLDLNTPYKFIGRVYPHPKNQQATLMLDKFELAEDTLRSFTPSASELTELEIFKPSEWSLDGIQSKLDDIYADIEANVTRIYRRRDMHLVFDLCYHSALLFSFDDQVVKGWTNILVAGDSSQGKSETALRLMEHYGVGERVVVKDATFAGLLGGLQKMGDRWFVSWGIIPQHDSRLVFLEEVKGAEVELIGKFTDMRSSGIAEIPKIEKRRTHARTRLAWISNPRSDRTASTYNFGVEIISELIGSPEDIRRFDVAIIVSSDQVKSEDINKLSTSRPQIESLVTSALSRRLVLYAWTRKPNQIKFDEDAVTEIFRCANLLCEKFTDVLPLCDRGSMKLKLGRLAVALAIRTFSTDDDREVVRVRQSHVECIYRFLDRVYSDPVFGYLDFSKAQVHANKLVDTDQIKSYIGALKYPKDFVENLIYTDRITNMDVSNWCETDMSSSDRIISFLVRKRGLRRINRWYAKTPDFIRLLKEILPTIQERGEAGDSEM